MSRKHEQFSYVYGLRYAPEQWSFYWNNKKVHLEHDTKTSLALLVIQGKAKEAEDILKRLLRKEEKEVCHSISYGFYGLDRREEYFFTRQLACSSNSGLLERLCVYKAWKQYLKERDAKVSSYCFSEYALEPGKALEKEEKERMERVDLLRPCTVRLESSKQRAFLYS